MTKLLLRSPQGKPIILGGTAGWQSCRSSESAQRNFEGMHVWDKCRTSPQNAQKGRSARPQPTITLLGVAGMIPTVRVQRGLSQVARCASTGIVPATPLLFQHPADRKDY